VTIKNWFLILPLLPVSTWRHQMQAKDASASHAIFLADCVYDICAGAGEVAAQLTAEIMRIE
jgi:hypothetical protein